MNELEQRIRELTLREPGDTLDQRVLSSLQSSVEVAARESDRAAHISSGAENARLVNSPPMNEPTRMRLGIPLGMITGLLAALLIGIGVGNGLLPSGRVSVAPQRIGLFQCPRMVLSFQHTTRISEMPNFPTVIR